MNNVLQYHVDEIDHIIDKFQSCSSFERNFDQFFDKLIIYLHVRFINDEFSEEHFNALYDYVQTSRVEYRRVATWSLHE